MQKRFLLLFIVAALPVARADDCPATALEIYSNQEINVQIFLGHAPANSIRVLLYSTDKLTRTIVTDSKGEFVVEALPVGKYHFAIPVWGGGIDLNVRPEKGANAPFFSWFLPHPKTSAAQGKKIRAYACASFALKED